MSVRERFRKGDWTAPNRGFASKETSRVERQNYLLSQNYNYKYVFMDMKGDKMCRMQGH